MALKAIVVFFHATFLPHVLTIIALEVQSITDGGDSTLSIVMYAQQRSSDVQYGEIMKLASSGHRLHLYSEPYGLLTEIDEIQCDLLIIDLDAQDTKTLDLIARARHLKQQLYIVVMADSDQYAMAAMKIGVQDFLKKPVEVQTLGRIIQKIQSTGKNSTLTHN